MQPHATLTLTCAALVSTLMLGACGFPAFDYENHTPARVSVLHKSLNPAVGEPVTFVARAEVADGLTAERIVIRYVFAVENADELGDELACEGADIEQVGSEFQCRKMVAGAPGSGLGFYHAEVTDSAGSQAQSADTYVFQIGLALGAEPFPLRAPLTDVSRADSVLEVAFVPHVDSYADVREMLADLEAFVPVLLDDPAYRWRDDQLSLWYYPHFAEASSYYSGLTTRCGGDPWPYIDFPAEVLFADAIGVVHRQDDFRDCASEGLFMAHASKPELIQHEMAHVLFGVGDEYSESTADREMGSDGAPPPEEECNPDTCCVDRLPICPNGADCPPPAQICHGLNPNHLRCGEEPPVECLRAPDLCPPVQSECALGQGNLFGSQANCLAAVPELNAHPGVEMEAVVDHCVQLCGSAETGPCPCVENELVPVEVWTVDHDDIMKDASVPNRHGPACERCIETRFCTIWESARGQDPDDVAAYCIEEAP